MRELPTCPLSQVTLGYPRGDYSSRRSLCTIWRREHILDFFVRSEKQLIFICNSFPRVDTRSSTNYLWVDLSNSATLRTKTLKLVICSWDGKAVLQDWEVSQSRISIRCLNHRISVERYHDSDSDLNSILHRRKSTQIISCPHCCVSARKPYLCACGVRASWCVCVPACLARPHTPATAPAASAPLPVS